MKKALCEPDGRVAQIEPINAEPDSGGIPFPVAAPLVWVDCPDDTTTLHLYLNGAFALPTPTLDERRAEIDRQRDEQLADGSIEWNGKHWHLDLTFQAHLTSLITAFDSGVLPAQATVAVRTIENDILQLGVADLKTLAGVVLAAVQQIWAQSWAAKDALQ